MNNIINYHRKIIFLKVKEIVEYKFNTLLININI